jgi:lipopolysaccharide biosynthesis glycosyltransferase
MTNKGVIYMATNSNKLYLESALISAIALRKLEPDLPIILMSDYRLDLVSLEEYRISHHFIKPFSDITSSDLFFSRFLKTKLTKISPFEETLYLDADVLPLKPIGELWSYLAHHDIGMVLDPCPTVDQCQHIDSEEIKYTLDRVPRNTVQYNAGVILWRKSAQTEALFDLWEEEWRIFRRHDQLALVRAIDRSGIKIIKLPIEYNTPPIKGVQQRIATLLHCWGGIVPRGRFPDIARVFYPELVEEVKDLLRILS